MRELNINYNGKNYNVSYNEVSGYYEIELLAPEAGGVYDVEINYMDAIERNHKEYSNIQVFAKESIKIISEKTFMWIFDSKDFSVKDIVEISDYEINIDEETNANTLIKVLKENTAKANDIVAIKRNNELIYWGIIEKINNENGKKLYEYTIKYITNIFNQKIKLENEELIKTTGIEDFIAKAITDNFINNADTFINKNYLQLDIKTHTKKQTSVSNVQDGIYNLHTWMTNCTQNYDIVYSFAIVNKKLVITIENKEMKKEIIDTQAMAISDYSEVFETNVVSKVIVLTSTDKYTLYLLNDRTTTEDMTNTNRADGSVETVYTEKYEEARQKALDIMKANTYNHNVTFKLLEKIIKVGTPVAIKTKKSIIYDSYISAVKITRKKFIEYTCGNIRIKFIDKLLKERRT